jgi:hypothetical protein
LIYGKGMGSNINPFISIEKKIIFQSYKFIFNMN